MQNNVPMETKSLMTSEATRAGTKKLNTQEQAPNSARRRRVCFMV